MSPATSPNAVLGRWRSLRASAFGRRLFSWSVGRFARYTGSIQPRVEVLEPGHAVVRMRDRAAVRNHLRSVHAVAMLNLGEVASGLALLAGLHPGARAILVGLSMEYHKKARGTLTAECRCPVVDQPAEQELEIQAAIRDAEGDEVATATARWRIGPKPEPAP